jgi:hypothetical protein
VGLRIFDIRDLVGAEIGEADYRLTTPIPLTVHNTLTLPGSRIEDLSELLVINAIEMIKTTAPIESFCCLSFYKCRIASADGGPRSVLRRRADRLGGSNRTGAAYPFFSLRFRSVIESKRKTSFSQYFKYES